MDARQEINERLEQLGWSVSRLAREAEVDRSDLNKWLNETRENIKTVTLDALREALGHKKSVWRKVPK